LNNTEPSIISSNCNGGVIAHDLGLRFNSPFVNLFIKADDFIKLVSNLSEYMDSDLVFTDEYNPIYGWLTYPTAYLNDVKIYFMHYKSEEEVLKSWNRRKARINFDNIFILFSDRSGCTQEDLEEFDHLKYKNKIVFTHIPHPEIKSSFYIRGYENEKSVGILSEFENAKWPIKRRLDQFDYVKWFNDGVIH